tara:strand:+ start:1810 stop:2304 length:495 start_codon:yes stop_codon:yes gene_type:complete
MKFFNKNHQLGLYNTLLNLSRNIFFYKELRLKDSFETRIYLMFFHYSIILLVLRKKRIKYNQQSYDDLFDSIENNLRELGFGDVSVNKKMKDLNKIFYDVLLKIDIGKDIFQINEKLILKYFDYLDFENNDKIKEFRDYFVNFYKFCFDKPSDIMIEEAINFKN